jgi:hypothetical protein
VSFSQLPGKFFGPSYFETVLERLGIQMRLYHRLSKFDRSVFVVSKPIYFFGVYMAWLFYLETIGVS